MSKLLTDAQAAVAADILALGLDEGAKVDEYQLYPARNSADNAKRRTFRSLATLGLLKTQALPSWGVRHLLTGDLAHAYQRWQTKRRPEEVINGA